MTEFQISKKTLQIGTYEIFSFCFVYLFATTYVRGTIRNWYENGFQSFKLAVKQNGALTPAFRKNMAEPFFTKWTFFVCNFSEYEPKKIRPKI